MIDFDALQSFVQVAEHGGYAAAERAMDISKSRLSRHVAQLETRLGTRLIERSTRRFALTQAGQLYLRHARAAIAEARAGEEAIARSHDTPCGVLRMSCPTTLLELRVGAIVAMFLRNHPQVEVELDASNRVVDPVQDGVDIAIRVRALPLEDSPLVMRRLNVGRQCLVASPALLSTLGTPRQPGELMQFPSLALGRPQTQHIWDLHGPDGAHMAIHHRPRLVTRGMSALCDAAVAGVGIVQLPRMVCAPLIAEGRLQGVLPGWAPREELVHAVFPSRQGLSPAAHAMLGMLSAGFDAATDE